MSDLGILVLVRGLDLCFWNLVLIESDTHLRFWTLPDEGGGWVCGVTKMNEGEATTACYQTQRRRRKRGVRGVEQ